jgi:copper chaperone CopZ
MKRTILMLCLMLTTLSIMAKDIKTVVVTTTPQMHCNNCEMKIKNNLRFEKGVKKIETSIDAQTVTITYDADKTNVSKLLDGFGKFGYSARELKSGEKVDKNSDESCPNM